VNTEAVLSDSNIQAIYESLNDLVKPPGQGQGQGQVQGVRSTSPAPRSQLCLRCGDTNSIQDRLIRKIEEWNIQKQVTQEECDLLMDLAFIPDNRLCLLLANVKDENILLYQSLRLCHTQKTSE